MKKSLLVASLTLSLLSVSTLTSPSAVASSEQKQLPSITQVAIEKATINTRTLLATSLTQAISSEMKLNLSDKSSQQSGNVQRQLPSIAQVANEKVTIEKTTLNATVTNYAEYKDAMIKLYTELPNTMKIKSTLNKNQMEDFSKKFEVELVAGDLPNYKLLANYKMKKFGNLYTYTDNSHKNFSAKQIETYINTFATRYAESIEDLSPSEKFNSIYNYVYSNFKYNANGYQYMMVGNAYDYEMACNGISRLMFEMLNAADIDTRIIEGEDHYYNLVSFQSAFGEEGNNDTLQGDDWFIVDATTDILLKKPHGSTGTATNEYLAYVLTTDIYYTAKPIAKETTKTIELKDEFIAMITNNLSAK